ncbi:hypothetical protein M407DRAFT_24075 [Tulasnella calospora MUT 4182]|uniref:BTB domain-containing protein n=1 Tax=Tulasnella calospora MUT 4182 TaxID=1051891 RepID=A0A0C3QIF9_9AGAM|nr:hypothetical protein M407DRAFT_24075 [Tulasnella calospora MUT 4182]
MRALGIGEGGSQWRGSVVEHAIAAIQAASVGIFLFCHNSSSASADARPDGTKVNRPPGASGQMQGVMSTVDTFQFVVPPPFDESSPGDCHFVSSDGIQFKVLRHSLVPSSRYFQELFQYLPSSTSHTDLPTFYFDDNARLLHALLIVLYPVHTPEFIDIKSLQELTDRQEKYAIPYSTMMHAVSVIVGRNYSGPAPTEDLVDVYTTAWSNGYRREVKHFSRFMHKMDLTDQSIVDRLIRNSGSSKSYVALTELRRQRETALDGIIEALEPRKHFCLSHSSSDAMFFAFISMMKTAARSALLEPRPTCNDAFEFLGLQPTDENRTVTWCSTCYSKADKAKLTNQLKVAIERYPQTISIMPDKDAWALFM